MPGEMGLGDVQQKFESSILMYRNAPVLFLKIAAGMQTCRLYDLMGQQEMVVDFNEDDFAPPIPRIGMVNIGGSVIYVNRIPVRRYKLGLSTENLRANLVRPAVNPDVRQDRFVNEIRGLRTRELAMTLLKKFPTKKAAFRHLSQFNGTVAIDKQFAVTSEETLIYKQTVVGRHNFEKIKFNDEFKHLEQILKVK